MNSFPDKIIEICRSTHLPMIHEAFGDPGIEAAFNIMETAKDLFRYVEPERISGEIIIYHILSSCEESAQTYEERDSVEFALLSNQTHQNLVLEVTLDKKRYLRSFEDIQFDKIGLNAIIYHNDKGSEEFIAKGKKMPVFRLDSSARSQFSIPTLSTLREALKQYAHENIRESTCYLFRNVWYDENRIFLKASPEAKMRNSLVQFLRNRLGSNHDVWPEQNVDESHPVDIRVQPRLSNNRLLLIEIKWLGDSIAEDGHITAKHREARAQQGADQLSVYLDDQLRSAPNRVIHGYYVIIDARRRNLSEGLRAISQSDGYYYENKELAFNPAPHLTRKDFDPPYRMFAKPVCCAT